MTTLGTEDYCARYESDRNLTDAVALYEAAMRRLAEQDAEYAKACEDWDAQGFRPKYCVHGTYLWTDYDPICGACEEGLVNEQLALSDAIYRVRTFLHRMEEVVRFLTFLDSQRGASPITDEVRATLVKWTCETVRPVHTVKEEQA